MSSLRKMRLQEVSGGGLGGRRPKDGPASEAGEGRGFDERGAAVQGSGGHGESWVVVLLVSSDLLEGVFGWRLGKTSRLGVSRFQRALGAVCLWAYILVLHRPLWQILLITTFLSHAMSWKHSRSIIQT